QRVVEHRQLLHGFEEPAQVQQERGEHTYFDRSVHHSVSAVDEDRSNGDVSNELDSGGEDCNELERSLVREAEVIVQLLDDFLVTAFATECLHGADPAEGLDKVHNDERDSLS